MRAFSRGLDHCCQNEPNSRTTPRGVLVGQPCASCFSTQDTVLHAIFGCLGLVVVHKPPGWEVGTQARGLANDVRIWLQSSFPEMSDSVAHVKEHSFGFAHRLDKICSGLLLAAVTTEASSFLQWQLSGGIIMRECVVFCHESMLLKLQEVDVHIFHSGWARTYTTEASISGAPSHTATTMQAHIAVPEGASS